MIRILQVVNRLNLGGITYNAACLAARLGNEFDCKLAAGIKDDTEESSEHIVRALGVEPIMIPDMRREISPAADLKALNHIRSLIREFKPHIVHTHAAKAGMLGRLAAFAEGVPCTLHTYHGHVFHSYFGPVKTSIFLNLERLLALKTTRLIAISNSQKYELSKVFRVASESRFKVVELGYDLDPFLENMDKKRRLFRTKYHLDDETIAIGMIGRIVPVKNVAFFLRCYKKINEQFGKKVQAFVVGDGEDRKAMEKVCSELGLAYSSPEKQHECPAVTFTSWIYEVDEVMAGLDIIALTSLNEGTPASLIEAQAAGKPIISTDVGGVRNIVEPGKSALLVPSNDSDAFIRELARLSGDPDLRESMKKTGPALALQRFHYRRLVEEMRALYKELLLEKKAIERD